MKSANYYKTHLQTSLPGPGIASSGTVPRAQQTQTAPEAGPQTSLGDLVTALSLSEEEGDVKSSCSRRYILENQMPSVVSPAIGPGGLSVRCQVVWMRDVRGPHHEPCRREQRLSPGLMHSQAWVQDWEAQKV